LTKPFRTHRQFSIHIRKRKWRLKSASIAQGLRLYLRNQAGESMGRPREREPKSLSARIEICGTGKSVDDSVRALIDEWIVPNLVEAFLQENQTGGGTSSNSFDKKRLGVFDSNLCEGSTAECKTFSK
jgi:hypothetical protein